MRYACDISGLGKWKDAVDEAFAQIGVQGAAKPADWQPLPGCGIVRFKVEASERYKAARIMLMNLETDTMAMKWMTWPDNDGVVTIHIPAGEYGLRMITTDTEKPGEAPHMMYTADGWQPYAESSAYAVVKFEDGKVLTLPDKTW